MKLEIEVDAASEVVHCTYTVTHTVLKSLLSPSNNILANDKLGSDMRSLDGTCISLYWQDIVRSRLLSYIPQTEGKLP